MVVHGRGGVVVHGRGEGVVVFAVVKDCPSVCAVCR